MPGLPLLPIVHVRKGIGERVPIRVHPLLFAATRLMAARRRWGCIGVSFECHASEFIPFCAGPRVIRLRVTGDLCWLCIV